MVFQGQCEKSWQQILQSLLSAVEKMALGEPATYLDSDRMAIYHLMQKMISLRL